MTASGDLKNDLKIIMNNLEILFYWIFGVILIVIGGAVLNQEIPNPQIGFPLIAIGFAFVTYGLNKFSSVEFRKEIIEILTKIQDELCEPREGLKELTKSDNITKDKKIKPEIDDLLKIYSLYQARILKEYDLIWNRFKIYFSMNSGLLIILAFLIGINNKEISILVPKIGSMILIIAFIGIIISCSGIFVNVDGKKWQHIMNQTLVDVEKEIFSSENYGLYSRILINKSKADVLNINILIFASFLYVWILIGIYSFHL
jgi:hypothetical protein